MKSIDTIRAYLGEDVADRADFKSPICGIHYGLLKPCNGLILS